MASMRRTVLCVVTCLLLSGSILRPQSPTDDARLPGPRYPEVVALRDAGRPRDAIAALARQAPGTDDDSPIEAVVLRAQLLADAGAHRDSAAAWQRARARAGAIAPVALRHAVENLVHAGDPAQAEALLEGEPTRDYGDLLVAIASSYGREGRHERAAAICRRVIAAQPAGDVADEAALGLAAALEEAGDGDGALEQLTTLQRRFRRPATFARARAEAARLARALGRPAATFTSAEYRALADRLPGLSLFDETLALLDDWRRAFPADAPRIEVSIVDTLYRARQNAEARSRAEAFLRRSGDSPQAADVRVLLFRLDVREGRTADVRTRGEALWTGRIPGVAPNLRLDLGRLLAAYLVSVGQTEEGLDVYRAVYLASTEADFQSDVMWRVSVAAIRAGQLDRAETNLRALRRRRIGRDTSLLVEYWTGALAERQGRRAEAVRLFTELARREPYEYYGHRARERLAALGIAPSAPEIRATFPPASLPAAVRATPQWQGAALLARAGLNVAAAGMARDLAAEWRGEAGVALLAARASAAAGDHRQALDLVESRFRAFLEQPARDVPDDFWQLAYPLAFWDDVRRAAAAARVDPLLLLALARQESRFAPAVRSIAGAVGLFQLMPYTADALASRVGFDVTDPAVLLRPAASATLAAELVSDLMRLFGNADVAVMAAYNAGDERGAGWWRAADGIPEDLFVDTIPYAETRNYVRTVYANYAKYRELYGGN
jgi:soluble lytic murein transglycosylase